MTTGSRINTLATILSDAARLLGKVSLLVGGEDVGPSNPVPAGGVDDGGTTRPLYAHPDGAIYARPDWRGGTNYLDIPRSLTSTITGGGRHSSSIVDTDRWSFGDPLTTSLSSVQWDPTNGEMRLRTPGAAGERAMLLDNKGALYVFAHDVDARWSFRSTNPILVGKRQEWGLFVEVGSAAPTNTAIGFYLEDGVWGLFLRVAGFLAFDIPQVAWNYDRLDGTGPSGLTITPADLGGGAEYRMIIGQRTQWFIGNILLNVGDLTNPAFAIAGASVANPFVVRVGHMLRDTANTGVISDVLTHSATVECLVGNIDDAFGTTTLVENITVPSIASADTKPIVAVRVAATISGVLNSYRIVPFEISAVFSTTGNLVAYWGTSDDITLTGGSWVPPPKAPLSVAEINVSATAVSFGASASQIRGVSLAAGVPVTLSFLQDFSIFGRCLTVRGDGKLPMLVVAVTNTGAGPGTATLGELRLREVI